MRCAAALGTGMALMLPLQTAQAFGGAGNLGECASFTTCTAGVSSSAFALARYNFDPIFGAYTLPVSLVPGVNTYQDTRGQETTAALRAAVGDFCVNCYTDNPFYSSAAARSQSQFGVNRSAAATSVGASGTDSQGVGRFAHVDVLTVADAASAWRDVWSFSADGHLSATLKLDGQSSTATNNLFFPSTFSYGVASTLGDWFYEFSVWDVNHLSPDSDGFPGPTRVAHVRDQAAGANEQRGSFASDLKLDFDYVSGVSYVVIAQLAVHARNGRDIDLYNTARLSDVALSNAATLSALSGHDYVAAAVPEPQTVALFAIGLVGLALHRRRPRAR